MKCTNPDHQQELEMLIRAAMEYGWQQGKRDTPKPPDPLIDWTDGEPHFVTDLVVCSDRI